MAAIPHREASAPGSIYQGDKRYRNSHYFRSQIFHVRNFRVTIFSSISRMRHIFATYNTIGK